MDFSEEFPVAQPPPQPVDIARLQEEYLERVLGRALHSAISKNQATIKNAKPNY